VKMTGKRPERAINSSPGQTSPRWLSGRVSPWGKCTRSRIVRGRIFFNEQISLRTKQETFSKFVQFVDQHIHPFRSIKAGSLKGSCDFSPGQVSPRWLSIAVNLRKINKYFRLIICTKSLNQYEKKQHRSGAQAVQIAGRRERDETDLAYQRLVGRRDR